MTKQDARVAPEPTLPGLPPEVRERILFFALPSAGRKNFVVCRADAGTAANHLTAGSKCLSFHKKQCPGVALVNKQISQECVDLLQKTKNFGFCSAPCLRSFLTSIHPDFTRKIDKISCKKVISEHSCQRHHTRPFADLIIGVHASMQQTMRPAKWRSVLTLDLIAPQQFPVATLMVQAYSSTDHQSSGPTEFEDAEVYDVNKFRKAFVGTFEISIDLDKEVLEARDLLLAQEFRRSVARLAGAPVGGLNVTFVALHV
ncbi:uncharacterized protein A1O9_00920 [Exophiala aquamarina CBS 119918]|uniref:F-box domain-containing protein n=1 Tax=Exophiala aquamarina CBS 119918 TaxID=1182545 RepID=A0A072PSU1_9EURO|nr:uncharacterized protein A1O9_00920 [Exophiala aquamarina CBS 119918]KEF62946.1 hypothetical protein A1O9_00920 [Exophiala aquamarina CBS 119918]